MMAHNHVNYQVWLDFAHKILEERFGFQVGTLPTNSVGNAWLTQSRPPSSPSSTIPSAHSNTTTSYTSSLLSLLALPQM